MGIHYKLKPYDQLIVEKLAKMLDIPAAILQLLVNRSINTVEKITAFFHPTYENLHDPFLLSDMEKAVDRICAAIDTKEIILVHGDYDADGICSTSLLLHALRGFGATVDYYIPNRIDEGYGLKIKGVEYAQSIKAGLILTCDCGVSSVKEVDVASGYGIDTIITDHHEPGKQLPDSFAIVNPKLKSGKYPFDGLAGVGVAAKLILAIYEKKNIEPPITNILRICAIGTIADAVPLSGENRFIAQHGLQYLSGTQNIGLQALFRVAGLTDSDISSYDVAFRIAPRINAAGRFGKHQIAMDLLFTRNVAEAQSLAQTLNEINTKRQQIVEVMFQEAINLVDGAPECKRHKVLVVAKSGWNKGLVGLVASKLVELFNKPALAIAIDEGVGYGSARSIDEFDLINNMQKIESLFNRYGGHKMAAGFEIAVENIIDLREKLVELADEQILADLSIKELQIDAQLEFSDLDNGFLKHYKKLEPFGQNNEKPVFMSQNVGLSDSTRILKDKHLKLQVTQDGLNGSITALAWNMSERARELLPGRKYSFVYTVEINSWRGKQELQLNIIDFSDQS